MKNPFKSMFDLDLEFKGYLKEQVSRENEMAVWQLIRNSVQEKLK